MSSGDMGRPGGDTRFLRIGGRSVSTVAFLNIAMHGRVNPTLPVVAELVRRGHSVTYHTSPAFSAEIAATGATVHLYPGGDPPLPDPPIPVTLLEGLARTTVRVLPTVLTDLRGIRPDLIVHDAACLWGAVAARELDVPAAASFTTFAFNRHVLSPTRGSWNLLASATIRPGSFKGYLRSRWELHRRFNTRGLPIATALAPLGGTVIVSTGQTDPAALGPLPVNVLTRRSVPQPDVLARSAIFITHGGMNSVNEAMYAGVPMLVVPQGADQPLVASRVVDLDAGLSIRPEDVSVEGVRALAQRLLDEPRFRAAASTLQTAQRQAGGYRRAADTVIALIRARHSATVAIDDPLP